METDTGEGPPTFSLHGFLPVRTRGVHTAVADPLQAHGVPLNKWTTNASVKTALTQVLQVFALETKCHGLNRLRHAKGKCTYRWDIASCLIVIM